MEDALVFHLESGMTDGRVRPPAADADGEESPGEESSLARFGATLAHELRGPLAPIANGMHILKSAVGDDARALQVLSMMERQMSQLTSLLDDLMDVGGFRSAKVRTGREHVDLHHVISASVEACAASIDARGQDVRIESDGATLEVRGDLRRLTQVFTNLLTNSCKYTPTGGHIIIDLARIGDEAVVEVRDNGMGMSIEDLPHVFELFSQGAEHRYAPRSGLGIGLSVVRNIVNLHGGTVSAYSDGPGHGSTFRVRLPICC
jgi:signal transduction histidine kinase